MLTAAASASNGQHLPDDLQMHMCACLHLSWLLCAPFVISRGKQMLKGYGDSLKLMSMKEYFFSFAVKVVKHDQCFRCLHYGKMNLIRYVSITACNYAGNTRMFPQTTVHKYFCSLVSVLLSLHSKKTFSQLTLQEKYGYIHDVLPCVSQIADYCVQPEWDLTLGIGEAGSYRQQCCLHH